jgi:hypothetical protein
MALFHPQRSGTNYGSIAMGTLIAFLIVWFFLASMIIFVFIYKCCRRAQPTVRPFFLTTLGACGCGEAGHG